MSRCAINVPGVNCYVTTLSIVISCYFLLFFCNVCGAQRVLPALSHMRLSAYTICFTHWPHVGQALAEAPLYGLTVRATGSAGFQLGDLPAYDAHPLGGVNCVRGYDEGAMGTARHWAVANTELDCPVGRNDACRAVAFVDAGSDLNSGQTVVGDPAGTRGKPGRGFGYGVGLRLRSPMGLLRFEYGWHDGTSWLREGGTGLTFPKGRLHIGMGSRF